MPQHEELKNGFVTTGSIAGHYTCGTAEAGARVDVFITGPTNIWVLGRAFWGSSRQFGPNIGLLDLEGSPSDSGVFHLSDVNPGGTNVMKLHLQFVPDGLLIKEENGYGYFGMNATFHGEYLRQGNARLPRPLTSETVDGPLS